MKKQVVIAVVAGLIWAMGRAVLAAPADPVVPENRLAVSLYGLTVTQQDAAVVVEWQTAAEGRLIGFNLYRTDEDSDSCQSLNAQLLPCLLNPQGGVYVYRDDTAVAGTRYTYRLDGIGVNGRAVCSATGTYEGAVGPLGDGRKMASGSGYLMTEHPANRGARTVSRRTDEEPIAAMTDRRRGVQTGERLKIRVRETGMYHLDAATLAQHFGITTQEVSSLVEEQMLRLSCQGEKCAWIPAQDGDGLFFYNEAINSFYTYYNVFWLERGRGLVLPGAEMPAPEQAFDPMSRMKTFCFEEQLNNQIDRYYNYLEDYWLWTYNYGGSGSTSVWFTMKEPIDYSGETASAEMVFCGGSNSGVSNEHHAIIRINGTVIGESHWEKAVLYTGRYSFAASVLSNGVNQLTVTGVLDSNIVYSLFFMDRFSVTCLAKQQAVSNRYLLPSSTNERACVTGFTATNLYVVEVLGPALIRPVPSFHVSPDGAGGYAVSFYTTNQSSEYAVFTVEDAWTPDDVYAVADESLRSQTNAVDYLLITHPQVYAETLRLEQFRAGQHPGLRTRTVLVDDVYNAFSHGIETPEAITRFLKYAAAEWAVSPQYVLFAGEGSHDYKNYRGLGENLVPTIMTRTPDGIYSADNVMADIVGNDAVPDFSIGRLPAISLDEMSNLVSKVMAYESDLGGTWTNTALLVADNADSGGNFKQTCETIAGLFPDSHALNKIYLDDKTIAAARTSLLGAFNSGAGVMIYFGHGGWNRLAAEGIMTITAMSSLTNAPRLPIVLLETCTLNRFEAPLYDYFGEALILTKRHGAVAVWGPSGESLNNLAEHFCQYFLEDHYAQSDHLLGDAVRQAAGQYRRMGYDRFECEIMTLLGDPMTTIK